MTNLNWNDLRYFLALVDSGSLTAGARRLKVEHTTVARRIEALEEALGLRLFERLQRQWKLTPEGENLLAGARRLEQEALALERTAAGAAPLAGTVRISAPPVIASHLLVPQLGFLRQRLPGIALEVVGESREANLTRREADIALRLSRPSAAELAVRPLIEIGYGLYGAKTYLAATAQDAWDFIGYEESLLATPQQKWLEKIAAGRPFPLRSNDLSSLYQAVRAGLGVSALPHFLARGDRLLKLLAAPACPVVLTVWLVMHPEVRRSPRIRAVADGLIELFGQDSVKQLAA
ncbi:LysR family transcriptional regulator [Collimonas pratensis]|uniref:Bacterial regulatory helix-turn-helix, lysR family protein n=1 Tax=Collimonas pratensis TaxID=279113 RepID=A0ABM5Z4J1_9BURK|nr:LysR family transcriptional regulator [Collimonas pratensis]AMP14091.1 bacterial regulatory helix-turn-helix, lysR family protein [Collimonas pratensis]